MARPRFLPDNFTLMLIGTVLLASVLPVYGSFVRPLELITIGVIFFLFFLHGAKLSRPAIWAGISHWRLHLLVTAITFVVFPVMGWALRPVLEPLLTPDLYLGVLFLCTLPATVQSAVTLTAVARGNMPAAICSASGSTLMGIVITPLLVGLLLSHTATSSDPLQAMGRIALQLLLPFALGHGLRPWVGPFLQRHAKRMKGLDQSSILLVVYSAFSASVVAGLWSKIPPAALAILVLVCALLLALSMGLSAWLARRFGFSKEDEITIVFCGAQKSLVSGVPMAKVLFEPSLMGVIVLPLMIFHPMQLMLSAWVAGRYAQRQSPAEPVAPVPIKA
ncbi:bile acid:sodium symporter [Acidovorax sp. Be4]|uniref:Bile acid:sodium symporter n=1 Tax=Acidovorax bellezanensis TaxID=2976702 RepID=A0ABT2PNC5_9BURK|nr:bile acid:sodium symporter family protein [Acidovorax sp. Be4]MCT9811760.1 bile acid:sodium symporter [Acidovorax sp. Be4]